MILKTIIALFRNHRLLIHSGCSKTFSCPESKILGFKRGLISLGIVFMGISEGRAQESIQGKAYPNRINGVYDTSVTNQEIDNFLESLKKAVKQDDPAQVAKLLSYPCQWNTKKYHKTINSEKEFIQNYKFIMTEKVKRTILCTCIDDLFVNSQGFMIGNGEVWFDPRIGIITFNS